MKLWAFHYSKSDKHEPIRGRVGRFLQGKQWIHYNMSETFERPISFFPIFHTTGMHLEDDYYLTNKKHGSISLVSFIETFLNAFSRRFYKRSGASQHAVKSLYMIPQICHPSAHQSDDLSILSVKELFSGPPDSLCLSDMLHAALWLHLCST